MPRLTLDSTLGELIDHPEAYASVMRIITQHSPQFKERLEGQTNITLRQAINGNPRTRNLRDEIEVALAALG